MNDSLRTNQALLEEISRLKQTIEELQRSEKTGEIPQGNEALLKIYFENAPDGIYALDVKGNFLYGNRKAEEIIGYRRDELIGKNFLESNLLSKKDINKAVKLFQVSYEGKPTGPDELELINKKGRIVPVEINTSVVQYMGQKVVLGFVRDITERKRAEKALRESERKFHILFDSANDAIFIMKNYRFVECNHKTLDMFRCNKEDIIGRLPSDVSPEVQPDGNLSSEKGIEKMDMAMKGAPQFFEWRHTRKDGIPFDCEVSLNSIAIDGDTYLQAIVRDVTERQHVQEEIAREREKLKVLSDSAPFGLALIDREGRFTYINAKFTDLFGYDLSDTPDGRTWFRKAYPNTEYRHEVISTWIEDIGNTEVGERIPRVFTVTCKDGTQKIVEFISSTLATNDYLMVCEDITELKRLESRLRQSQKMEAVGTLAGGIAHDFNNILTSLMGYANLMQMKMDKTSPLRSYLDQIISASRKAADLTRSLLAFSRQSPAILSPLDINNTIETTNQLLKRLMTEDIELRTSLMQGDAVIMADKPQIDQILFNLATNARDAMPQGGILIIETDIIIMGPEFINVHGFGEQGKYVLLSVSDTGEGMDEATREKIFDPFFTTKEIGKGTGLGLATVYGIVKQHNGYITVYSEPGHGTTFRIYFPTVQVKVNEERDTTTPITRGGETVLIAEDDEEVRCFMREALEEYGYKTVEAIDGEDAINKFRQHRDVDLIIIDSVMPKKNGREVYDEIRKKDPHIKVLFTSGYTRDIVLNKGIEDHEFNFIAKPLQFEEFLQKVREILDR